MNRRRAFEFYCLFAIFLPTTTTVARAQSDSSRHLQDLRFSNLESLVEVPAISGYEKPLVDKISSRLSVFHPSVDNLGDVVITIGSGAPHRLLVTGIDEPGFVVSNITDEGYLRVQRLPQGGLPSMFNELYSAQPVRVGTLAGGWIDGVVAGLSVHLAPGRASPPKSSDLDEMYIDVGASSAAEVRKAGVDVLSPIAMNRRLFDLGETEYAGTAVGDRFGAAALVELLGAIDPSKIKGTLTVAFVVQQRVGARGLQRILTSTQTDELIYVGRLFGGSPLAGSETLRRAPRKDPGSGVLAGADEAKTTLGGFAADLKHLADANQIPFGTDYSASLLPPSYLPEPALPSKWAHIGLATAWADTAAETISSADYDSLVKLLEAYTQAPGAISLRDAVQENRRITSSNFSMIEVLQHLAEAYGVSNHEERVRETVRHLLPAWATPETDGAGNLILHVGTAIPGSKAPRILIVAHMDEIGFEVKSISKDGRLEIEWRGGGVLGYFAGHPALVHTGTGDRDAVIGLPDNWDQPNFKWPPDQEKSVRADVGAHTAEDAAKLGIRVGDWITIPKAYRPLLGTRANARSFDDRAGDTALISAVWALGAPLRDRDVTFVWSTGEELGLVGAGVLAKRLAEEGQTPDYVFAVDTFVSSDSPLESKRFADAEIGKGFVVRAIDNSNIVPRDLVTKVLRLAGVNQIPAQFGVTGGGNDGSAFVRYGSVDVALGWALRYAHSPAEVIDTRDVEALGRIVAVIARSW